jgi:hypothetical protein
VVGQQQSEAVPTSLGQQVFDPVRQVREVLCLIDVQGQALPGTVPGPIPVEELSDMFDLIEEFNSRIAEMRASKDSETRLMARCRRPVGVTSMYRILATLRKALNDLIRTGLITFNPAKYVELPVRRTPIKLSERQPCVLPALSGHPALNPQLHQMLDEHLNRFPRRARPLPRCPLSSRHSSITVPADMFTSVLPEVAGGGGGGGADGAAQDDGVPGRVRAWSRDTRAPLGPACVHNGQRRRSGRNEKHPGRHECRSGCVKCGARDSNPEPAD